MWLHNISTSITLLSPLPGPKIPFEKCELYGNYVIHVILYTSSHLVVNLLPAPSCN